MPLPTPTLQTARLLLRLFNESDTDAIFTLQSSPQVVRYWDSPPWKEQSHAEREIACVCLSHIVEVDPAVCELADIQPGWWAVRDTVASPWVRESIPPEEL